MGLSMLKFVKDFNNVFGGPIASAIWTGSKCVILIAGKRAELDKDLNLRELDPNTEIAVPTTCGLGKPRS